MADTMQFDLVSPERKLASGEADMVVIPGMEGDLGALPGHAAFLTTLRPGVVTVTNGSDTTEYSVTGGFAEVSGEAVAILAEETVTKAELTREYLEGKIETARTALENATDETRQSHGQRLNDLTTALEQIA